MKKIFILIFASVAFIGCKQNDEYKKVDASHKS